MLFATERFEGVTINLRALENIKPKIEARPKLL